MDLTTLSKETLISIINDLQKEVTKFKTDAEERITKMENLLKTQIENINSEKLHDINKYENIWYMNGNAEDLKKWEIQVKNNYVWTWSDNGKNDSIQDKIEVNDLIAWHIVSKGYNSILKVLDKPHLITDEELKISMTYEEVIKKRESMKTHNYSIIFIPVEFLTTTTTNFVKKETISEIYNKEWTGGLRGSHCINPTNPQWKNQVFEIYNYLKKFD